MEMSTLGMMLRALVDREEVAGILHHEGRGQSESAVEGCLGRELILGWN